MDFVSNQTPQIEEMLAAIGIQNAEELWADIPKALWKKAPLEDDGMSEYEGLRLIEGIAAKNSFQYADNYLGAGAYEHHVPALVQAITSQPAFLTSYTPYQAEVSQGLLQAIFEFQTCICALTEMDVSNASLYDGASACAEALLMAVRLLGEREEILVGESLHPHYLAVIKQYLSGHGKKVRMVPCLKEGNVDAEAFHQLLSSKTAAVLLQYPNFFGVIDPIKPLFEASKHTGAINILCANPLAYGLYATAHALGADIAVGDVQPFGLALQFGGPYAGYISCRKELVRQLPGRIVGMTKDTHGNKGFVLTLQAREQHIRREKATSNICTNQALAVLASLITMLWYGKKGIGQLALANYQRASYLKEHLEALPKVKKICSQPIFNEFVIELLEPIEKVQEVFRYHKIEPGLDLGRYFKDRQNHLLIAVTETKNKQQLDRYLQIAKEVLS